MVGQCLEALSLCWRSCSCTSLQRSRRASLRDSPLNTVCPPCSSSSLQVAHQDQWSLQNLFLPLEFIFEGCSNKCRNLCEEITCLNGLSDTKTAKPELKRNNGHHGDNEGGGRIWLQTCRCRNEHCMSAPLANYLSNSMKKE
jgi:hypothetical protein